MSSEGHGGGKGIYWAVFAGLGVFTVLTVGAAYLHMAMAKAVPLALLIATIKTTLVARYFMHLKGERAVIFTFLGLTVAFVVVLITLPLLDMTAQPQTIEGAIPAVHGGHSAHEIEEAAAGHPVEHESKGAHAAAGH
jgi:caa(3)-type oxidase subunit IV